MSDRLGQLDEISSKIGELTAYTHEHRHGVANLSMKLDALSLQMARLNTELEGRLTARLDVEVRTLVARIDGLERERDERAGAGNVGKAVIRWWPAIAGLFTVIYLILRAVGILHLPSDPPARALAPASPGSAAAASDFQLQRWSVP